MMTCGVVLFAFSLLYIIEVQGHQHVFVLLGQDLQLDVKKSVGLDRKRDFFWKFNTTNYVGKISYNKEAVLFDSYETRAELFGQNYSLVLKNVKHSDSGDYTAIVTGEPEQRLAEHKVIVQDPVTPAKLTVDSVSKSIDSCNLTVTCSTVDLKINSSFRCDGKNCSHIEEKDLKSTKNVSSLTLYWQQDTIFCNHSNKVSWIHTMKVLRSYCETKTVTVPSRTTTIAASTSVPLLIFSIILCIILIMKCKSRRGNQENTIYAVPEDIIPGQTQSQTPSGHESCNSPTSTYALVKFHTGQKSAKTENIPQPETVYVQVDRAAKPNSTVQQQTPRAEENQ